MFVLPQIIHNQLDMLYLSRSQAGYVKHLRSACILDFAPQQVIRADLKEIRNPDQHIYGRHDVVAPRETTHLNEAHAMTESEEAECRRRITAILETIEDGGAEYLDYLDEYIKGYQERYTGDGESC